MEDSFSILNLYKLALSACTRKAGLLIKRIWLALLAIELAQFFMRPLAEEMISQRMPLADILLLSISGGIVNGIFYLILVVAVHRTFLLEEHSVSQHVQWQIRRYELRYLRVGIRLFVVFVIPVIVLSLFFYSDGVAHGINYFSALWWGIALGWVGMVFPAAAIDSEPRGLSEASQFSKPYRWKLIVLLTLPQLVPVPLYLMVAETMENVPLSLFISLLWNLLLIFQIALLTLAYKQISQVNAGLS